MMTLMKRLMASPANSESWSDPVTARYSKVAVVAMMTIATTMTRIKATKSAVWRGMALSGSNSHSVAMMTFLLPIRVVPQLGHGVSRSPGSFSLPK